MKSREIKKQARIVVPLKPEKTEKSKKEYDRKKSKKVDKDE